MASVVERGYVDHTPDWGTHRHYEKSHGSNAENVREDPHRLAVGSVIVPGSGYHRFSMPELAKTVPATTIDSRPGLEGGPPTYISTKSRDKPCEQNG